MDFNFYSSRDERLSQASSGTKRAYEKRNKKGFLQRNPQLKILFIDLILVLIFAVIIIPFFLRLTKDVRFDDYKVSGKATVFEENILVTVKISNLYKKVREKKGTDNIIIDIIDEEYKTSKQDKLPLNDGEDKYITFKLDDNKKIEIINTRISSGNFVKEYKITIDR